MSRRFFTGLVVMMALSIIGITWVQIIWIKNAVDIRNENFNNAVFISLNNAASEIESLRKMNFFNNFIGGNNFTSQDSSANFEGYFSFGSSASQGRSSFSINIGNNLVPLNGANSGKSDVEKHIRIPDNNQSGNDSLTVIITSPDNKKHISLVKKEQKTSSGNASVYLHQKEYLDWVRKQSDEFRNLSNQMITEIYEWEKTMELDNNEIGNSLHQYLAYSGINTPFEFAVIKDGAVGEGTFNKASKNDFLKSPYKVRLFPDNIIKRDVILSVVFPRTYKLRSRFYDMDSWRIFAVFIIYIFNLCTQSLLYYPAEKDFGNEI